MWFTHNTCTYQLKESTIATQTYDDIGHTIEKKRKNNNRELERKKNDTRIYKKVNTMCAPSMEIMVWPVYVMRA